MLKYLTAPVLGLFLLTLGFATVSAQIPYIQAYFCPTSQSESCLGDGVESQLCIYTHNFHATYNVVEFAVSYPAAVTWVSDHVIDAHVILGDTPNGITLGYIAPFLPPFVPSLLMTVTVRWNCGQCAPPYLENQIIIVPHPGSGYLSYVDVATATIWNAVGMTTMVCSALPTEETTWGKIKALYFE